jgi:hypothetical protein
MNEVCEMEEEAAQRSLRGIGTKGTGDWPCEMPQRLRNWIFWCNKNARKT